MELEWKTMRKKLASDSWSDGLETKKIDPQSFLNLNKRKLYFLSPQKRWFFRSMVR